MLIGKKEQFGIYELVRKQVKDDKEALKALDNSWNVFSWNVNLLFISILVGIGFCAAFVWVGYRVTPEYFGTILRASSVALNVLIGGILGFVVSRIVCVVCIKRIDMQDWEVARKAIDGCSHVVKDDNVSLSLEGNCLILNAMGKTAKFSVNEPKAGDVYTYDTDIALRLCEGGYVFHKETVLIYINGILAMKYVPYEEQEVA